MEEVLTVISGQMGKKALSEGDLEGALIACGQYVELIHEIKSVKELIEEIIQGVQSFLQRLNYLFRGSGFGD